MKWSHTLFKPRTLFGNSNITVRSETSTQGTGFVYQPESNSRGNLNPPKLEHGNKALLLSLFVGPHWQITIHHRGLHSCILSSVKNSSLYSAVSLRKQPKGILTETVIQVDSNRLESDQCRSAKTLVRTVTWGDINSCTTKGTAYTQLAIITQKTPTAGKGKEQ